jgi:hypothetical protein
MYVETYKAGGFCLEDLFVFLFKWLKQGYTVYTYFIWKCNQSEFLDAQSE